MMKLTFQNPKHEGIESSIAIPWLGVLAMPIRTLRLVWMVRKLSRMEPERAERTMHMMADEYEARGMRVTRTETRPTA